MTQVQTAHVINAVAEAWMITVHGKAASHTRTGEVVQSEIAREGGRSLLMSSRFPHSMSS